MSNRGVGQFYTTNCDYILDGFKIPKVCKIIEPFAGQGDLIKWIRKSGYLGEILAYDINPKKLDIEKRDTVKNPPNYTDAWVLTNPPYLARNKSENKEIFDLYRTNDLYKCFIYTLEKCVGGVILIPAGFFFSSRDVDFQCRHWFMSRFKITKIKYFEETVFSDTPTTIVAVEFTRISDSLSEQIVPWIQMPTKQLKEFKMTATNKWIIGGEIYNLPILNNVVIRRTVQGQPLKEKEQQTFITLNALDSGKKDGRICLKYQENYIYPAKESSRTYATLRITGMTLSPEQQIKLCSEFNSFLEKWRQETWSLFLPQYRESKEYARKRIPFELAYHIILHLLYLSTK